MSAGRRRIEVQGFWASSRERTAHRLHKLLALGFADRILLLWLSLLLTFVACLIQLMNFRRTYRLLERLSPTAWVRHEIPDETIAYAQKLGQLTQLAGRYLPFNASCLRQSLVVWWLLRLRKAPAVLRIGVRNDGAFAAHAWVELGGQLINESADIRERFMAFERVS